MHHLTAPSVNHYWTTVVNIKYETCYPFAMPESLEDHRRLLVAQEDDIVFLLAVGTGKARVGRRQSLSCAAGETSLTLTRGRCIGACSLFLPLRRTRETSAPPSC